MAQILNNANKDTAATSDALTTDVILNIGGNFSGGAILYISVNPSAGSGYTYAVDSPDYLDIKAKTGTTLSLNIEGGDSNTAIDADLL